MNKTWNNIVARVLGSRMHRLMSGSTLVIKVKGRKSGRDIEVPVNYAQSGRHLNMTSRVDRNWWRNLRPRAGALRTPVSVLLRGKRHSGNGVAFCGAESTSAGVVAEGLKAFLSARPNWAGRYGVKRDASGALKEADLARAARSLVYVEVEMDD